MKNLMLGSAIALVFGSAVSAQELFRTEMDPVTIPASDFIGKRVYAAEAALDAGEYAGVQDGWNDIGEINDVILSRDGRVDAVLVDIGGFLGMGERRVAIGMENVQFIADSATADALNDYFLVINADRATLEGAPEFSSSAAMPMDAPAADQAAAEGTAVAPLAEGEVAPAHDATMATETAPMAVEGQSAVDLAGITADQLRGARVYGANDEDVGEISEVVMDAAGAPAQVIVDVGGFLGMGEKPVAIDLTSLRVMKAEGSDVLRVYVQMTQEQLETLPEASM